MRTPCARREHKKDQTCAPPVTRNQEPDLLRVCGAGRSATGKAERFHEFWAKHPRKVDEDAAAREWLSYVTDENLEAVFACLERYLQSAEVERGTVMNAASSHDKLGWIARCAKDTWRCDWPRARDRDAIGVSRERRRQAEIDREWAEVTR